MRDVAQGLESMNRGDRFYLFVRGETAMVESVSCALAIGSSSPLGALSRTASCAYPACGHAPAHPGRS